MRTIEIGAVLVIAALFLILFTVANRLVLHLRLPQHVDPALAILGAVALVAGAVLMLLPHGQEPR